MEKKNIFLKIKEWLSKIVNPKGYDRQLPERPDWETVVEMMYDKEVIILSIIKTSDKIS